MKRNESSGDDPVLICPACGNTEQFAVKTILCFRAVGEQYHPLNSVKALEFLERYSRNILFVNHRFLGRGAKMAYPLRYGKMFIAEYNDAIYRDILHTRGGDIRERYSTLKIYGGLVYCISCGAQADFYDRIINIQ